jgi:hypothetical protein
MYVCELKLTALFVILMYVCMYVCITFISFIILIVFIHLFWFTRTAKIGPIFAIRDREIPDTHRSDGKNRTDFGRSCQRGFVNVISRIGVTDN